MGLDMDVMRFQKSQVKKELKGAYTYHELAEELYDININANDHIKVGNDMISKIFNGGLIKKEITFIIGQPMTGKSIMLLEFVTNILNDNRKVLLYNRDLRVETIAETVKKNIKDEKLLNNLFISKVNTNDVDTNVDEYDVIVYDGFDTNFNFVGNICDIANKKDKTIICTTQTNTKDDIDFQFILKEKNVSYNLVHLKRTNYNRRLRKKELIVEFYTKKNNQYTGQTYTLFNIKYNENEKKFDFRERLNFNSFVEKHFYDNCDKYDVSYLRKPYFLHHWFYDNHLYKGDANEEGVMIYVLDEDTKIKLIEFLNDCIVDGTHDYDTESVYNFLEELKSYDLDNNIYVFFFSW